MTTKLPKLGKNRIEAFKAQIWAFYGHSGRKLPWRRTRNPYKILVSEVMLQQTQVSRVLEKYPEFLRTFPTAESLAKASLTDVLRVWQGMGYNRRAKYLRDAAIIIMRDYKGRIPKSEKELRDLPGIGQYTANAILTFAYNKQRIFIETNIRRIFIHHFFDDKGRVDDQDILPLVAATLDLKNPREWYYALMDYGSYLPKIVHRNSNTQSKHYAKQSTFKGSLRELRGKLIRALGTGPETLIALKHVCNNDKRTKDALDSLSKDNLTKYENRKYKLA